MNDTDNATYAKLAAKHSIAAAFYGSRNIVGAIDVARDLAQGYKVSDRPFFAVACGINLPKKNIKSSIPTLRSACATHGDSFGPMAASTGLSTEALTSAVSAAATAWVNGELPSIDHAVIYAAVVMGDLVSSRADLRGCDKEAIEALRSRRTGDPAVTAESCAKDMQGINDGIHHFKATDWISSDVNARAGPPVAPIGTEFQLLLAGNTILICRW